VEKGEEAASNVQELIQILNETNLGWIAEEIREDISDERLLKKGNDYYSSSYSSQQQLEIAVGTIRRYTIDLFEIWSSLSEPLRHLKTELPIERIEVIDENGKYLDFFGEDLSSKMKKLNELLDALAPNGVIPSIRVEELVDEE